MTFDTNRAGALREAINKTLVHLTPPAIGGGIPGAVRDQLVEHLGALLKQERLLFTADAPWYPDDSGEWVEVPGCLTNCPVPSNVEVEVLSRSERDEQIFYKGSKRAGQWEWDKPTYLPSRIVAYKVVKS